MPKIGGSVTNESSDAKSYQTFKFSSQKDEKYNELNSVLRSMGLDSDNSDDDFDETEHCKYSNLP